MYRGGIKHRHLTILLLNKERDFRAAENDALRTASDEPLDHSTIIKAGFFFNNSVHQLVIDNPVHSFNAGQVRDNHLNAMLICQSAFVELLLHGESGSEQGNFFQSLMQNLLCYRINNMQNRYSDALLYLRRHLVHRVGTDHQKVGTATLHPLRGINHDPGQSVPVALVLEPLNFLKIHGVHQALAGMVAP